MSPIRKVVMIGLAIVVVGAAAAGAGRAAETPPGTVSAIEIQYRIDQQLSRADADRQAIADLLQRPDVRRIAATVGLDLERAAAAATVLSGDSLEQLAAQARTVNADLAGGDTVVIQATTLIIILLVLILLMA